MLKVLKKRPMLYNGIFGCHGNICKVHSIYHFEINRYKIDEFRKHAKIVCFILCHVTQNGTSYVIAS